MFIYEKCNKSRGDIVTEEYILCCKCYLLIKKGEDQNGSDKRSKRI